LRSRNGLTRSSLGIILFFYLLLGIFVVVVLAGNASVVAFGNVPVGAKEVSDRCAITAPGA
jgi:hypothetical protein